MSVGIAKLAHRILGDPEENMHRFREFFQFGSAAGGQLDPKLQTLALLSATAVMIDIFPSLLMVQEEEQHAGDKVKTSKEHQARVKRAQEGLKLYD